MDEYKLWTVGKIEGSISKDLLKRLDEVNRIIQSFTDEREFIRHTLKEKEKQLVEPRTAAGSLD